MHENLRYEHGKPHTGWSSCESRKSVSCTKIHDANTESPPLSIPASRVIKNTQRTGLLHKAALWLMALWPYGLTAPTRFRFLDEPMFCFSTLNANTNPNPNPNCRPGHRPWPLTPWQSLPGRRPWLLTPW